MTLPDITCGGFVFFGGAGNSSAMRKATKQRLAGILHLSLQGKNPTAVIRFSRFSYFIPSPILAVWRRRSMMKMAR